MIVYLVFDTETTGLVNNLSDAIERQPRIIELAAVKMLSDGTITEEFERLFDPGKPVDKETTEITGITPEMLKDARPFKEHAAEVARFFDGVSYFSGHNVMFDATVLQFEFARAGMPQFVLGRKQLICTIEQTEHLEGKRLNLGALHTHLFGVGFEGAHRAMRDVKATARCLAELIKRGLV